MTRLVVDVLFRGKVLETIPFDRPVLRIGRLAGNDVVLDNLGVSRFHARLHRGENAILLEDAGSENGCLVNGERVAQRRTLAPGDRIEIGKHELVLRRADAADDPLPPRPSRRKDDAWDGGRTYVLGMPGGPRPGSESLPSEPEPREEPAVMTATTKVQTANVETATPDPDQLEPVSDGSPELDFGFDGSLAEEVDASAPPAAEQSSPPALHAGFIVQVQGKLERVVAWRNDVLVAGRSSECDIVLGQDEVSRRHVRFERKGDVYEVSDLGSVNGTFVNGRRIERGQVLQVGDIVQVEGFTLTFVLDRQPIDGVVAPQPVSQASSQPASDPYEMTMLQEVLQPIEEEEAPAAEAPPLVAEALPEADLLDGEVELLAEDEALDEKPEEAIEIAPRGSSRAASVQDLGAVSNPNLGRDREVCFELRVRVDLLPPALREAFEEAGASEIVLPAELRLKR